MEDMWLYGPDESSPKVNIRYFWAKVGIMTKSEIKSPLPKVCVITSDAFSMFHVSIPFMVFRDGFPGERLFDVTLYSAGCESVTSPIGLSAIPKSYKEGVEEADIVVIPFWPHPQDTPEPDLLETLCQAHQRGAQIVGLCLGTYILAYAGLLDGKNAATHWDVEEDFKKRFPKVRLNTNVLYVDDDGLVTSAGTAAGLDCCLHIVRKTYGSVTANKIARMLVIPPHRDGGQAQFIDRPLPLSSQDEQINSLLQRLGNSLEKPCNLDELAASVMMSRRTFTRHFQKATGMSVVQWLTAARLRRTQELLEGTDLGIDQIAINSGFQSTVSLRKQFKAQFGVSPSDWKKTFRG